MECSPPGSSVCGDSPGKNTGLGCHALLRGILPTQGSNPGLFHCQQILYHLSHQGSPRTLEWVAYPFSRGTSRPRDQTRASCNAGGFFTSWATREALLPLLVSSYCPTQSRSPLLDLVPLWGDQFLQSQNLLPSFCWPWGNAGPLASQEWGGGPRTASPSWHSTVLFTYRNLGPVICLYYAELYWANQLFIQHLDLFAPLCSVLWDSYPYVSSPKIVSPRWAHIASSPTASPLQCLCKDISVSLRINPCVQLVMFNFLEVVKKQFIF